MTVYNISGIFFEEDGLKLKEKLEGKTYMNFKITIGGGGVNRILSVSTEADVTEEELKSMFISCMVQVL